jgi:hypothetical protein
VSGSLFPLDGLALTDRWALAAVGESVWLLRLNGTDDAVNGDAGRRFAPHEQDGPLPPTWRAKVIRVAAGLPALPPRCGRPTRADGHPPCRARVAEPGQTCQWHDTGQ